MDICHEGQKEKKDEDAKATIEMPGATKEMLAKRRVRHMLRELQLWLNIGFDLEEDRLTARYLGVDLRKIPKVELTDQIY